MFLCGATDGGDGPDCEAAGAIASSLLCASATDLTEAQLYLEKHDSYHYFQSSELRRRHHIFTGPTETNVMDILVITCQPLEELSLR